MFILFLFSNNVRNLSFKSIRSFFPDTIPNSFSGHIQIHAQQPIRNQQREVAIAVHQVLDIQPAHVQAAQPKKPTLKKLPAGLDNHQRVIPGFADARIRPIRNRHGSRAGYAKVP